MRILICYATTEGQTRKICRFCADRLVARGHSVELLPADAAGAADPVAAADAAILAGSVHVGALQESLAEVARAQAEALNARPSLLLVVSLAAAGDDAEERAELDLIAERFCGRAGWQPDAVHHVAGAFRFTQYDFFRRLAMRYIARRKDQTVDAGADREYTDWDALGRLMDRWPG